MEALLERSNGMKVARRVPGIFAGPEPEEREGRRAHSFRVGRRERGKNEVWIKSGRRSAERFGAFLLFLQSGDPQNPRFNESLCFNALKRADGNNARVVSAREHGFDDVRHAVAEKAEL